MSMFIMTQINAPHGQKEEFEWHVGEGPIGRGDGLNLDSIVIEMQADGDELDHIRNLYSNIPFRDGKRAVRWYGEMAKFIVGNL